ncbi:rab9 effector protein with kelch motifs-like isoform X2 [Mya arenaria]|uniref:rab9 effector protein with kelch motifs-like isoform X2 n=1 Tax=Mya arenaria TaxID=6604 RepID=UPI0022E12DFD|nr:rab9 effector protein with kelch motifs-like isoform X2 [Mya arenaria]
MNGEGSTSQGSGIKIDNDMSLAWKRVTDCVFPVREGQCSCSVGNKMYIFGGVIHSNTQDLVESNDLLCFDAESGSWSLIEAKGSIPEPRIAASLVSVDTKLYLYGGLNQESGWMESFYMFDTESKKWSAVESEGSHPSARDKLQGAVIDRLIYYFGGFGPQGSLEEDDWEDVDDDGDDVLDEQRMQQAAQFGWFNDLYMFDTDTRKWNLEMEIRGELPAARSFHTTTAVGNQVIVIGGRGQDNTHLADLHVFDTETYEWSQPKLNGEVPCARGQHSVAVVVGLLVLFGGSSDYDAENRMCRKFFGDTYTLQTADLLKGGVRPVNSS